MVSISIDTYYIKISYKKKSCRMKQIIIGGTKAQSFFQGLSYGLSQNQIFWYRQFMKRIEDNQNLFFFWSIASVVLRKIHHDWCRDRCRQLLFHYIPIAGAWRTNKLIKVFLMLEVSTLASCRWYNPCSPEIRPSWEAFNCNQKKKLDQRYIPSFFK